MCLPSPSTQVACDTRSIFGQSLTDLNLEFSIHTPVAITRLKNSVCPTIHRRPDGEIWKHIFLKSISTMWKVNCLDHNFLLGSSCPFPTPIPTHVCVSVLFCFLFFFLCVCVCVCVCECVCERERERERVWERERKRKRKRQRQRQISSLPFENGIQKY